MYGYIYRTTNVNSGKIYIGKCSGKFNPNYKGSGRYITNAINKYGTDVFDVVQIDSAETLEELNAKEIYWISFYRNKGYAMYNISKGGDGGDTYANISPEDRAVRIEKLKRNGYLSNISSEKATIDRLKSWETRRANGYVVSEETRRRLSLSHKGKTLSPESIAKGIATKKANGYHHSAETIEKIRKGNQGKRRSDEVRSRLSAMWKGKRCGENNSFYGKHHSAETKAKISEYNKLGICGAKGRIWINNGIVNKRIEPKELDSYLSCGYVQGRMPFKHKNLEEA